MNFWRRCGRLTKTEKVRDAVIMDGMRININIIDTINDKRLSWFGYLQRMPEERWPKKI